MRVITFKAEEDLVELLDRFAAKYGLNRSEMIRALITAFIENELKKEQSQYKIKVEKGPRL